MQGAATCLSCAAGTMQKAACCRQTCFGVLFFCTKAPITSWGLLRYCMQNDCNSAAWIQTEHGWYRAADCSASPLLVPGGAGRGLGALPAVLHSPQVLGHHQMGMEAP